MLLQSHMPGRNRISEQGIPCAAKHFLHSDMDACSKRKSSWDSLPPFLLMYSKKKLGRRLKTIFQYDDRRKTLRLKCNITSCPWLNYNTSHGQKPKLSLNKPWWNCMSCSKYWHEAGQLRPRVPMRNWLEGTMPGLIDAFKGFEKIVKKV